MKDRFFAAFLTAIALTVPRASLDASELHRAVRVEEAASLSKALDDGVPLGALDASGRSALFYATVTRKSAVVKRLLDAGAKVSVPGQTREPLWAAVVNGDREITAILLEHGADPEDGMDGWRPVDAAILSGRVPVLEMLMESKPGMRLPEKFAFDHVGGDSGQRILLTQQGSESTVEDELAALLSPLPPDIDTRWPEDMPTGSRIQLHASPPSLPQGADHFVVCRVVPQPDAGHIWWSGGLVKGEITPGNSPAECLPALARVDLNEGKITLITSPSGWGDFERKREYMINPWHSVVHAREGRVVWHLPKIGVYEVDPADLKLTPLKGKIGSIPSSINSAAMAGTIIGDAFYVSEQDEWTRDARGADVEGSQRVLRLRRGEKPVILVETSRRPEVTALDRPPTQLTAVAADKQIVRVFANTEWTHRQLGPVMATFPSNGSPDQASINRNKNEIEQSLRQARTDNSSFGNMGDHEDHLLLMLVWGGSSLEKPPLLWRVSKDFLVELWIQSSEKNK